MKRAVQIVSSLTIVLVLAATIAQALTVTQGITYDPNGQPINPSALTLVVTILGVAGMLSLPLVPASFALGIVATALQRNYLWLVAILGAGVLAFVGLLAMIWILLSANVPVAFQTPLLLVPLTTLLSTLLPSQHQTAVVGG